MRILWLGLYPFDPRIHMMGNTGFMGRLHAKIAPPFTTFLDKAVYRLDIRKQVLENYADKTILDMGCGTGMSTATNGIGIDTSPEMLSEANRLFPDKTFVYGNAENYQPEVAIDVVTCMFMMHEIPQEYRAKILNNAARWGEKVVVVDICPDYKPSRLMLMGEPYLEDYLKNIRNDLKNYKEDVLVKGHVHMWTSSPFDI
jgi:SAM-dependent methyltransferase